LSQKPAHGLLLQAVDVLGLNYSESSEKEFESFHDLDLLIFELEHFLHVNLEILDNMFFDDANMAGSSTDDVVTEDDKKEEVEDNEDDVDHD
jgi:hypothetical protein